MNLVETFQMAVQNILSSKMRTFLTMLGIIIGVCAVLVTYLLFSIISSSFAVTWLFALEIALGAVAGGISGIIGVNIKHKG